jgi:hypothetical protein
MTDFYKQNKEMPVPTMDLREFLVCRSGNAQLVDAFYRFVYGFTDPSPARDLRLRDDTGHGGSQVRTGPFWNSPDLWVRKANYNGTDHQSPRYGQDNWFYARVRNRSAIATAPIF